MNHLRERNPTSSASGETLPDPPDPPKQCWARMTVPREAPLSAPCQTALSLAHSAQRISENSGMRKMAEYPWRNIASGVRGRVPPCTDALKLLYAWSNLKKRHFSTLMIHGKIASGRGNCNYGPSSCGAGCIYIYIYVFVAIFNYFFIS